MDNELSSFLRLFLCLIFIAVVFSINRWDFQFIIFFFFALSFTYQLKVSSSKYKKSKKTFLQKIKHREEVYFYLIHIIAFILIGIIHCLGKLDFPKFLIIGYWNNKYVLLTRLVWLISSLLQAQNLYTANRKKIQLNLKPENLNCSIQINLIKYYFLNVLFYPPLFIPILITLAEFLKWKILVNAILWLFNIERSVLSLWQ